MENIFWKGFSDNERHAAMNDIQSVVSKYGYIMDFHFFSDISLSMTIEIEEFKIDTLYNELTQILKLQETDDVNSISKKERTVYLNITFSKGTGNLKMEVPSVPG